MFSRARKPLPPWLSEDDARALRKAFHVKRIEADRLVLWDPTWSVNPFPFLIFLLQTIYFRVETRPGPYLLRMVLRMVWIVFIQKALFRFLPERGSTLTFFPHFDHHVEDFLGLRNVYPNDPPHKETVEASPGRWSPLFPRPFIRKETQGEALRVMDRLFPSASEESKNPWQPPELPDGLRPRLPAPLDVGPQWDQTSTDCFNACNRECITFRASRSWSFIGGLFAMALLYLCVQTDMFESLVILPFVSHVFLEPVAQPSYYLDLTLSDHLVSCATVAVFIFLVWLPRAWPRAWLEIPNGEGVLVLRRFGRKTKRVPFLKSSFIVLGDHDLVRFGEPRHWWPYALGIRVGGSRFFLPSGCGEEDQARYLLLFSHGGWEQAVADYLQRQAESWAEEKRKKDEQSTSAT